MAERSVDDVDVKVATPEQLATFATAQAQLEKFSVPKLYNSSDPNARVFVALFDGTGNDAIKDPQHLTNVGLLMKQIKDIKRENPNIGYSYKEGPGTQGGLTGLIDGATGGTYQERVEVMYDQFDKQAAQWLKENPNAKISVVNVGFSRGAEQAAGFARLVEERGIQDPHCAVVERSEDGLIDKVSYKGPPLQVGGKIAQASLLYDPVATGEPESHDRRPPPSMVSGLQIKAADEHRTQFPSNMVYNQGVSADGRFLGVTTAGAHSDIGGGYLLNGLSSRNFNLGQEYLNGVLGEPLIKAVEVPNDPKMSVVHDSTQHEWFYRSTPVRGIEATLSPTNKPLESENKELAATYSLNVKPIDSVPPIGAKMDGQEYQSVLRKVGDEGVRNPQTHVWNRNVDDPDPVFTIDGSITSAHVETASTQRSTQLDQAAQASPVLQPQTATQAVPPAAHGESAAHGVPHDPHAAQIAALQAEIDHHVKVAALKDEIAKLEAHLTQPTLHNESSLHSKAETVIHSAHATSVADGSKANQVVDQHARQHVDQAHNLPSAQHEQQPTRGRSR